MWGNNPIFESKLEKGLVLIRISTLKSIKIFNQEYIPDEFQLQPRLILSQSLLVTGIDQVIIFSL